MALVAPDSLGAAGGFRVKRLLAALLLLAGLGGAQAQSLDELYQAAHDYDATYLSARSLADRRSTGRRRPTRCCGRA